MTMRYALALLLLVGCGDPWDLAGDDVGEHPVDARPRTMTWSARNSFDHAIRWDMRSARDGRTWTNAIPPASGDIVGALDISIECMDGDIIRSTLNATPEAAPYDWRNPEAGVAYVCGAGNVLLRF